MNEYPSYCKCRTCSDFDCDNCTLCDSCYIETKCKNDNESEEDSISEN